MYEDRIPKDLKIGEIIDGEQLAYFEAKYGKCVISDSNGRGRHLKFEVLNARPVFIALQTETSSSGIPQPRKVDFYEVKLILE